MVSAIFSTEISSLESQVAALQAQIAQAQQRITALGEVEFEADGALQALTSAVQKVSALAPGAIATFKTAVFALFNSGSDGSDKPEPNPEPPLDGESCDINPDAYWDSATPDGSSWELACPITFQLEVEPVAHCGTKVTPTHSEGAEKTLFNLISVSPTVSYMRKDNGEIVCAYAGFNNKTKAKQWGEWLAVHHSVASGFEVREAKRLTDCKHELKLWGISLKQIKWLAGCDLMKSPPSNYGDAPKRKVEPVPSMLEIENIGIGDIVRSITVKNWEWKVLKINSDGFYECDRIGANPPISQTLHPGSVELVTKADIVDIAAQELEQYLEQRAVEIAPTPTIDPTDVPRGVVLRQTNDDILIEYLVYAWVIVRNQGRPEAQQRQIGRLVEGLGIIEAYKPVSGRHKAFSSTMDAVNFLINTSDYRQSDIDAGVALFESRQHSVLVGVGAEQSEEVEF